MKLTVEGIDFSYEKNQKVLEDIELSLNRKEVLGVVGPNGSGKSTLLKCLNGILNSQNGDILIKGENLDNLNRRDIAKKIGYVPQRSNESFPSTVFDTILMGRKPYIGLKPSSEDLDIVTKVIKMLGLEKFSMKNTNELSGGQRQKVLIGRALAQEPEILLLDEPTSDLDLKHQLEVLNVVERQVKEGISAIIAIHDLNLAERYSDRIVMLREGEVYASGGTEIFSRKNIESVYDVKVSLKDHFGRSLVVPEEPAAG